MEALVCTVNRGWHLDGGGKRSARKNSDLLRVIGEGYRVCGSYDL